MSFSISQTLKLAGLGIALLYCSANAQAAGDAAAGKAVFQNCAGCHQVGPGAANAFGPVLTGVVGRDGGSYEGYTYSASLQAANKKGLVWTPENLAAWLNNPSAFLKEFLGDSKASSNMPINFPDAKMREDVIAYLATLGN